jgi:hypothetical protein
MLFRRRPKNQNEMTKDVKKYLKKFEKYLKKNDVDVEYNSAGAITFPTETVDGSDYIVTVNGEEDIVWLTTILSIDRTVDEISILRAINELNGTKNPVTVHVEHTMNILMLTMCFNSEMTEKDMDAVMNAWWSGTEIVLKHMVENVGITIDWTKKL